MSHAGPAARHGFRAKILYASAGSSTDEFIGDLARELACPAEPSQKGASSGSFYSLFRPLVPAPECAEQAACLQQPACWQHIIEGDDASLTGYSSEVQHLCICTCCHDWQAHLLVFMPFSRECIVCLTSF